MNVYIIRNTMGEAVGLYYQGNKQYNGSGLVELITDYAGVKHSVLSKMVRPGEDNDIASVCMINLSYLERYVMVEKNHLEENPYVLPVADAIEAHMTADEACDMLGITRKTLDKWSRDYSLHVTKRGNRNLYKLSEIRRLMKKG